MPAMSTVLAAAAVAVALCLAQDAPGSEYKGFLLNNRVPTSAMPRSYAVEPPNYFQKVPKSERPKHYNKSHYIPQCQNKSVGPEAMDAYMFQSEEFITALGLNIYDGAMWCVALSLLGETGNCSAYLDQTLVQHKTIQFGDIRGDKPCKGRLYSGACSDPEAAGVCGFCYGDSDASLTSSNAYFFRSISDFWSLEGTVDARCPELKQTWKWNDYKPVLGENAWANLLGPAHVAMIQYKTPSAIPSSDPLFKLGIPFLQALEAMKVGNTGGFYYCPWNTWFGFSKLSEEDGATFSIENQGSLHAGLKGLQYVLQSNPASPFGVHLPTVNKYVSGLEALLLRAYDKDLGFFRQGATYNAKTGKLTWGQAGQPLFAVDCQTWVASTLGTKLVDSTLGPKTAYNLWQTVKKLAGYTCPTGGLCGVGYTYNSISGPVLSGEWTLGAINWLRVMIADSGYEASVISELESDVEDMQYGLISFLADRTILNNVTGDYYSSVKYANKRYYIPFGWYANPLPATSSTAWAVAVAQKYNPFMVAGGKYSGYGN